MLKKPAFSPAQPRRAETRLSRNKAAVSENAAGGLFQYPAECPPGRAGVHDSRVGFSRSLRLPVPKGPEPLHSILPALFRAHEPFQTGGDQGHKIRLVSGRELDNPPWRAGVRR